MTEPVKNSWTAAEENAFDWLLAALTGDAENSTAFIGEFPASFADATVDHMWFFAITGGGEPDDVGAGVAYCGMNAAAVFEGVFTSREDAQECGCTVKNLFPADCNDVAGLHDFRLTGEPSISRVVVRREADQTSAGEMRAWRLTIPLSCVVVAVPVVPEE